MASKRIVVAGGSGFLGTFVEDFSKKSLMSNAQADYLLPLAKVQGYVSMPPQEVGLSSH
jgi:hypothetical protein